MNFSIKSAAAGFAFATAVTASAASAQDTIDLKISHAFPTTHYLIENGLDIERDLAEAFPEHPLVSCLAFIAVSRTGPGEIHHQAYGQLVMGNFPAGFDGHCRRLSSLFREGGLSLIHI